jgi:DNA modification methylase
MEEYDSAKDAHDSYYAAVEAKRLRGLAAIRREVQIGDCRLILGDCVDILPALGAVGAVVMDPPYGIGWTRGVNKARNSKSHDGIQNDHDTSARDEILEQIGSTPAVVFGSFYAKFPSNIKQILVWHKPADSGLVGSVTGFRRDAEPIFLTGKWPVRTVEQSSVLRSLEGQAGTVAATGHPHTKPLELMKRLISLTPGDTILDPFMGSGSTIVACAKVGRPAIGIEIEERYFDIACRRVQEVVNTPDMFIETARVHEPTQEALSL